MIKDIQLEQVFIDSELQKSPSEEVKLSRLGKPHTPTISRARSPTVCSPNPNSPAEITPVQEETPPNGPGWPGDDIQCGAPYEHPLPEVDGDPWEKMNKAVKGYDDAMCNAWVEEIQNLLIFSGLFSAVVTAFVIETQKLLQEDPNTTSTLFLAHIASQVSSNTNMQPIPLPPTTLRPFNNQLLTQAFRINSFLFTSLIISLSTALFGILVLQWIRSYRARDDSGSHEGQVCLRQSKYDGLVKWRIPEIVAALPILLQLGLIVFFVGLLDFLHLLYPTLALVIGVFVSAVILVLIVTTILPSALLWTIISEPVYEDFSFEAWLKRGVPSAYRSPQSWAFFKVTLWVLDNIVWRWRYAGGSGMFDRHYPTPSWNHTIAGKPILKSWKPDALSWIIRNLNNTTEILTAACQCATQLPLHPKAMVIHKMMRHSGRLDDWFGADDQVPSAELEKELADENNHPFMHELLSDRLLGQLGRNPYNISDTLYVPSHPHRLECQLRCAAHIARNPSFERFLPDIRRWIFFGSADIRGTPVVQSRKFWSYYCSILADSDKLASQYVMVPWDIFWNILLFNWDELTGFTPDEALSIIYQHLTTVSTPESKFQMALLFNHFLIPEREGLGKVLGHPSFLACLDFLMTDAGRPMIRDIGSWDKEWKHAMNKHNVDAKYAGLFTESPLEQA